MTQPEIRKALRHAADVCVDQGRICWDAIDVCRADATADAAGHLITGGDPAFADTPMHAAIFLDLAAEVLGNL